MTVKELLEVLKVDRISIGVKNKDSQGQFPVHFFEYSEFTKNDFKWNYREVNSVSFEDKNSASIMVDEIKQYVYIIETESGGYDEDGKYEHTDWHKWWKSKNYLTRSDAENECPKNMRSGSSGWRDYTSYRVSKVEQTNNNGLTVDEYKKLYYPGSKFMSGDIIYTVTNYPYDDHEENPERVIVDVEFTTNKGELIKDTRPIWDYPKLAFIRSEYGSPQDNYIIIK